MAIEILEPNESDDVSSTEEEENLVDGSEDDSAPEGSDSEGSESGSEESKEDPKNEDEGSASEDGKGEPDGDKGSDKLTYNGIEFDPVYDPEMEASFKEKGLDLKEITKELYTSEDFTLTKETYDKVTEAFGKWTVDSYLQNLKGFNDYQLMVAHAEYSAQQQADQKAWDGVLEVIGGESVWEEMEKWANEKGLDISGFNSVMESGSAYAQKLAVKDMLEQYRADVGDDEIEIIQARESANDGRNWLTYEEYQQLHTSGKYNDNPKMYDDMRRRGQLKGL